MLGVLCCKAAQNTQHFFLFLAQSNLAETPLSGFFTKSLNFAIVSILFVAQGI
jgi:hypothetical protein